MDMSCQPRAAAAACERPAQAVAVAHPQPDGSPPPTAAPPLPTWRALQCTALCGSCPGPLLVPPATAPHHQLRLHTVPATALAAA